MRRLAFFSHRSPVAGKETPGQRAALAGTGPPTASPATLRDVVAARERRPYGAPLDDLPRELVAPARLTRRFPALCAAARSTCEPCTLAFSGDERLGAVALAGVCGCVEVRPDYAGALSTAPRVLTRRAASGAGWVFEPAPAGEGLGAVAAVARLGAALALVQGVRDER